MLPFLFEKLRYNIVRKFKGVIMMKIAKNSFMIAVSCILWWLLSNLDGDLKKLREEYLSNSAEMFGKQFLFIVLMILFVFSVSYIIKLQMEFWAGKK